MGSVDSLAIPVDNAAAIGIIHWSARNRTEPAIMDTKTLPELAHDLAYASAAYDEACFSGERSAIEAARKAWYAADAAYEAAVRAQSVAS
jgi:hypothetical protein